MDAGRRITGHHIKQTSRCFSTYTAGPDRTSYVIRSREQVHSHEQERNTSYDAPHLEIVGAVWGLWHVTANVSSRIDRHSTPQSLSIRASNEVFGDSWEGMSKSLTVAYRYGQDGAVQVAVAGEGGTLTIGANEYEASRALRPEYQGRWINVLAATYGLGDVTSKVREKIKAPPQSLSVTADNATFGDTWEGTLKSMVVVAAYNGEEPFVDIILEGGAYSLRYRPPFRVLNAKWGISDVTTTVRGAIRRGALSMLAVPQILRGGGFGEGRILAVVSQYGNEQPQLKVAAEGERLSIDYQQAPPYQPPSDESVLNVIRASYGPTEVTDVVRRQVSGNALDFVANNATFGDTWTHHRKAFVMTYSWGPQAPLSLAVPEAGRVVVNPPPPRPALPLHRRPPGSETYAVIGASQAHADLPGPEALSLTSLTIEMWIRLRGLRVAPELWMSTTEAPNQATLLRCAVQQGHLVLSTYAADLSLPPGWAFLLDWTRVTVTLDESLATFYLDGVCVGAKPLSDLPPFERGTGLVLSAGDERRPAVAEVAVISLRPYALSPDDVFSGELPSLHDASAYYDFTVVPAADLVSRAKVHFRLGTGQERLLRGVLPSRSGVACGDGSKSNVPAGSDYTLEAWLVPTASRRPGGLQPISSLSVPSLAAAGNADATYYWGLVSDAWGRGYRYALAPLWNGGDLDRHVFQQAAVQLNTPQHAAIAYSQSAQKATLILNGVEVDHIPVPAHSRPPGDSRYVLELGHAHLWDGGPDPAFDGALIRVRAWSCARTAQQVRDASSDYPVDDADLLWDYDLTDPDGPWEVSGHRPDPTGPVWYWSTTFAATPDLSTGTPEASHDAVLPALDRVHRALLEVPDGVRQLHEQFTGVDVDEVISQHAALRDRDTEGLPFWFERRDGELAVLVRDELDGPRVLVTARDRHDEAVLFYAAVAQAAIESCAAAIGISYVAPQLGLPVILGSFAGAPALVTGTAALVTGTVTAVAVMKFTELFARTRGSLSRVFAAGTKESATLRAQTVLRFKRKAPDDDPDKRHIRGKIDPSLVHAVIAQGSTQDRKRTSLSISLLQDRGEAILVRYTKNEVVWTMLVDGGYWAASEQPYDIVCGTHVDNDHIYGIWRLLHDLTHEDPDADEPIDPQARPSQLLINAPPPSADLASPYSQLDRVALEAVINRAVAGELDEEQLELLSPVVAKNIVTLARQARIPVNGSQPGAWPTTWVTEGFPIPNMPREDITVQTIGPKAHNLQWLIDTQWAPPAASHSEAVNRASIMHLLTYERKAELPPVTALLTGDSWDRLVPETNPPDPAPQGKSKQDIQPGQPSNVTLMKVPHHGSESSSDGAFYSRVTADIYLCSSWSGRYSLPRLQTLRWIVDGQRQKGRLALYYLYFVLLLDPERRRAQIESLLQALVDDPNYGIDPALPGRNYKVAYLKHNLPDGAGLEIIWNRDGGVVHPAAGVVTKVVPVSRSTNAGRREPAGPARVVTDPTA
jgi:hypothetical protein